MNIIIKCYIFQIVLLSNFSLNRQFWIFGPNWPKKDIYNLENKNNKDHHRILYFGNSLDTKFQLQQFWFFGPNLPKKGYFWSKLEKGQYHHWILHIRIGESTKFQFKLIILIFWSKFAQKGCLWSKTEKINTTTEFCIPYFL